MLTEAPLRGAAKLAQHFEQRGLAGADLVRHEDWLSRRIHIHEAMPVELDGRYSEGTSAPTRVIGPIPGPPSQFSPAPVRKRDATLRVPPALSIAPGDL
jgi:hypothetical protein